MRQKNALKSIRALVRLGTAAAALGTLLVTAPVGAQPSTGNGVTATVDQTGRTAQTGMMTTTAPRATNAENMQPSTVQSGTGMMTGTGSRGMMGSTFYSDGRGFPWGLLGLIGLLGLWPRSRGSRSTVD